MATSKKKRRWPWLFIFFLPFIFMLSSCDNIPNIFDITSNKETKIAEDIIEKLRSGDITAVEALVSSELATTASEDQLKSLIGYFPKGEPIGKKAIGFFANYLGDTGGKFNVTFEYQYPDKWALASVYFEQRESGPSILGLHVYQIDNSLEETHRFHLSGKPIMNYVALVAAISASIFTIYALYLSFKDPPVRRRWLWRIFIALGFCAFAINWTTGQWIFQPIRITLLSAAFMRSSSYSPWILFVGIPIGAVIFMIRRQHIGSPRISSEQPALN